jgi:hypothetical protein
MAEPARWYVGLECGGLVFLLFGGVLFVVLMNRMHKTIYHTLEHRPHRQPEDVRPMIYSSRGQYTNPQTAPAKVEDAPEEIQCPYQPKTMRWFVWWSEIEGTGYDVWESELGRTRYTAWRDSLIQAGWAEWNSYGANGEPNNTQGWHLLAPADVICENIKQ